MTEHDRSGFAASLAVLAEVVGDQLSPVRLQAYWEALQPYGLDEVHAAIRHAIRTHRYRALPLPAELIETIEAARRERRRELSARTRAALPAGPTSEEERQEAERARGRFADLVNRVARRVTWPRRAAMPVVSEAELQAHRARARAAAEAFRAREGA